MDERQSQVREGAGLEESRINEDFKDFLLRWGPRILVVVALGLGGYAGVQYYNRAQAQKVDEAFAEYNALVSGGSPAPESLIAVAESHERVRALPLLARLRAADLYLEAVYTGLEPGFDPRTDLNQDGTVANEEILLSEENRNFYLDKAAELYQEVLDRASASPGEAVHAVGASFGLGAVAEIRGEADAARSAYERAQSLAEEAGMDPLAEVAANRLESLDAGGEPPRLFARSELPEPKVSESGPGGAGPQAPGGGVPGGGMGGVPGQIGPQPQSGPPAPGGEGGAEQGEQGTEADQDAGESGQQGEDAGGDAAAGSDQDGSDGGGAEPGGSGDGGSEENAGGSAPQPGSGGGTDGGS